MNKHLEFTKICLILASGAIASVMLAISPSEAATFASSSAAFRLSNFNRNPLDVATLSDAVTNTFATDGQVSANANSNASFSVNPNPALTSAFNTSLSTAEGQGSSYRGSAESVAAVIGYEFEIPAGEKLSFDFDGFFNLETSIDRPIGESATAQGLLYFELYDSTGTLFDSFRVIGSLKTADDNDTFTLQQKANVKLNLNQTSSFGGTQESVLAAFTGKYSRTFHQPTRLTLVEVKQSRVFVTAPEPSAILGLFLGCTIVGVVAKRQCKSNTAVPCEL